MYPQTTSASGPQVTASPRTSMAQQHAEHLHSIASRMSALNEQLLVALDRLTGQRPPEAKEAPATQPQPDGVLLIAQFGAERLRLEADKYERLLARLNEIV